MAANAAVERGGYSPLKDLTLEINGEDGPTFSLCFWVYLTNSTPSSVLLRQLHPDIAGSVPFIALNKNKQIMLFPLLFLHHKAPSPGDSTAWTEVLCAPAKTEVPLKKWVHIGCEVSIDFVRLHIGGEIVGEKRLASSLDKDSQSDSVGRVSLAGPDGDGAIEGYVHNVEVLPLGSILKTYFVKEPPVQLSVDNSSATDIQEDTEGVWSIVGGKASCRRNFSLDVVLLDAFGQLVNKEMEVVASLSYADSEAPVEKPNDEEAPLLISSDGIEFASWDRPSKLINGRASFKLKISQLSSKCDNRLFRIKFYINKMERYPFLEVFSHPIRCISRNSNVQPSTLIWRRSTSAMHVLNGIQSSGLDEGSVELVNNVVHEAKPSPSSKWVTIGQGNPLTMSKSDNLLKQPAWTTNEYNKLYGMSLEDKLENHEETDNSSTESDTSEATNSFTKSTSSNRSPVSDLTVFKYCLGDLTERVLLLKDIAISASELELVNFAQQISLYSGCAHHRHQITISKRLIEEGTKAWTSISPNNQHVLWDNIVLKLNEHFMKIAGCSSRFLGQQDFDLLRRIGGCQDLVAQENFEKIWCWLYPVAFALSQDWINAMWNSVSPKWIEGLITKEEAESSLQGPNGLQDPGTFVLRFPTSRCWPHPDAGNLIVTYVGSDYVIHHRLLSLDLAYSSGAKETTVKPLKDMLLEEPDLSRLGRITRSYQLA